MHPAGVWPSHNSFCKSQAKPPQLEVPTFRSWHDKYHGKYAANILRPRPEFFRRFQGRNDLLDYAAANGIPVTSTKAKPYSMDDNIAHCSYEAGMLEDPSVAAPDDMWIRTVDPRNAPDTCLDVAIAFEKGLPIRLTVGETVYTDSLELFLALNDIGKRAGPSSTIAGSSYMRLTILDRHRTNRHRTYQCHAMQSVRLMLPGGWKPFHWSEESWMLWFTCNDHPQACSPRRRVTGDGRTSSCTTRSICYNSLVRITLCGEIVSLAPKHMTVGAYCLHAAAFHPKGNSSKTRCSSVSSGSTRKYWYAVIRVQCKVRHRPPRAETQAFELSNHYPQSSVESRNQKSSTTRRKLPWTHS